MRTIGADDGPADEPHALTLATAEVEGAPRRTVEELDEQVERIRGLRRIAADGVDPPLGDVVPVVAHRRLSRERLNPW